MAAAYPDSAKFRIFVDSERVEPFVLVTEFDGREVAINPGKWVDVECINGDGTPVEVEVRSNGTIAVYGQTVHVTDENGEERLY